MNLHRPPPGGTSRGGGAPRDRCGNCGHWLLDTQRQCPECGAQRPRRGHPREVPQLYTHGPAVIRPIAWRFAAIGAVAALGPLMALVVGVALPLLNLAPWPNLSTVVAIVAIPIPVGVILSLPYGPGSLGGASSPIPIERPRILQLRLHDLAAVASMSWWALAALLLWPPAIPALSTLRVLAMIGAFGSSMLHLHWLASLGESLSDDGPRRAFNICVGAALLLLIVAFLGSLLFDARWPFTAGFLLVFLTSLVAQIVAPMMLALDMIHTLIGAYEELGRNERRAQRAREHEPRLPT